MKLVDFELAGKESFVSSFQFVLEIDLKSGNPGFDRSLLILDIVAVHAALGVPPVAFFGLVRVAIEMHPGFSGRQSEINRKLTAG